MKTSFKLTIQTPNNTYFNEQIKQVDLCTNQGWISLLPNHCSFIGCLILPTITIHLFSNIKKKIICNPGIFRFINNEMIILTNFFVDYDNFDQTILIEKQKKINKWLNDFNFKQKIEDKISFNFEFLKKQIK